MYIRSIVLIWFMTPTFTEKPFIDIIFYEKKYQEKNILVTIAQTQHT